MEDNANSYDYKKHRDFTFTEEGQRVFLKIRDHVKSLQKVAGACTVNSALDGVYGGTSWDQFACIDRLVELGEQEFVQDWREDIHIVDKVLRSPIDYR